MKLAIILSTRPKTVKVGANVLEGIETEKIIRYARNIIEKEQNWGHPFGDGMAGVKIWRIMALGGAV